MWCFRRREARPCLMARHVCGASETEVVLGPTNNFSSCRGHQPGWPDWSLCFWHLCAIIERRLRSVIWMQRLAPWPDQHPSPTLPWESFNKYHPSHLSLFIYHPSTSIQTQHITIETLCHYHCRHRQYRFNINLHHQYNPNTLLHPSTYLQTIQWVAPE